MTNQRITVPVTELPGAELVGEEPSGDGIWIIRHYRLTLPPDVAEQVFNNPRVLGNDDEATVDCQP